MSATAQLVARDTGIGVRPVCIPALSTTLVLIAGSLGVPPLAACLYGLWSFNAGNAAAYIQVFRSPLLWPDLRSERAGRGGGRRRGRRYLLRGAADFGPNDRLGYRAEQRGGNAVGGRGRCKQPLRCCLHNREGAPDQRARSPSRQASRCGSTAPLLSVGAPAGCFSAIDNPLWVPLRARDRRGGNQYRERQRRTERGAGLQLQHNEGGQAMAGQAEVIPPSRATVLGARRAQSATTSGHFRRATERGVLGPYGSSVLGSRAHELSCSLPCRAVRRRPLQAYCCGRLLPGIWRHGELSHRGSVQL